MANQQQLYRATNIVRPTCTYMLATGQTHEAPCRSPQPLPVVTVDPVAAIAPVPITVVTPAAQPSQINWPVLIGIGLIAYLLSKG